MHNEARKFVKSIYARTIFQLFFLKATKKFQVKQNYNETIMLLKLSAQS